MNKKSLVFIVNPFSGVGNKNKISNILKNKLDHSKYEYDIRWTEAPRHATALAKEAADQGISGVIAVGGDGTVNEVAQSLIHTDTALGVLPGGSGNGFASHLGYGRDIQKAIEKLNNAHIEIIDSCTLNQKAYINVSGVGFDAKVAFLTKNNSSRGVVGYMRETGKNILAHKNLEYTIEYGQKSITDKFLSVNVANASMFGYNFTIAPLAELNDGLLDLVMVKDSNKLDYLLSSWRMLNQSIHKNERLVNTHKVKSVKISCEQPFYFHRDGEGQIADDTLHFSIVPQSVKVLWP